MIYTTKEGDVVDAIIWSIYGECNDEMLEAVFNDNKGLATRGSVLSSGIQINIPDLKSYMASKQKDIKLWD